MVTFVINILEVTGNIRGWDIWRRSMTRKKLQQSPTWGPASGIRDVLFFNALECLFPKLRIHSLEIRFTGVELHDWNMNTSLNRINRGRKLLVRHTKAMAAKKPFREIEEKPEETKI